MGTSDYLIRNGYLSTFCSALQVPRATRKLAFNRFQKANMKFQAAKVWQGVGDLIENPYFLAVIGKKMTIFVSS